MAVNLGFEDLTRALLHLGLDPNQHNAFLDQPLHWAARKNRFGIAQLLLDAAADVNSLNAFGRSPLHRACKDGHEQVALLLLAARANPNTTSVPSRTPEDSSSTPLHSAVSSCSAAIVRALVDAGADANQRDGSDRVPLQHLPVSQTTHDGICSNLLITQALLPLTDMSAIDVTGSNVATHVAFALAHHGDHLFNSHDLPPPSSPRSRECSPPSSPPLSPGVSPPAFCSSSSPPKSAYSPPNSSPLDPTLPLLPPPNACFELFRTLVLDRSHPVDLNMPCNARRDSIMHVCAKHMSEATVQWLVSLGGKTNVANMVGQTADDVLRTAIKHRTKVPSATQQQQHPQRWRSLARFFSSSTQSSSSSSSSSTPKKDKDRDSM